MQNKNNIKPENVKGQIEKEGEKGKKKSFAGKFMTFIMYGGWLAIAIVILAIFIAVSTCQAK